MKVQCIYLFITIQTDGSILIWSKKLIYSMHETIQQSFKCLNADSFHLCPPQQRKTLLQVTQSGDSVAKWICMNKTMSHFALSAVFGIISVFVWLCSWWLFFFLQPFSRMKQSRGCEYRYRFFFFKSALYTRFCPATKKKKCILHFLKLCTKTRHLLRGCLYIYTQK